MRLLSALLSERQSETICRAAVCQGWETAVAKTGQEALHRLYQAGCDLLLLHSCLAMTDGFGVLDALWEQPLCYPPRIVLIGDNVPARYRIQVDCIVPFGISDDHLFALLVIVSQKPLPKSAAVFLPDITRSVNGFLDMLSVSRRLKGRSYACWMLCRLVVSPILQEQPLGRLYGECARSFHTTAPAVERCIRLMVESVFTKGSIPILERYFASSIDPERGKPTNLAFLMQSAKIVQSSYSLAETFSPTKSEMHHSPAAPTSV